MNTDKVLEIMQENNIKQKKPENYIDVDMKDYWYETDPIIKNIGTNQKENAIKISPTSGIWQQLKQKEQKLKSDYEFPKLKPRKSTYLTDKQINTANNLIPNPQEALGKGVQNKKEEVVDASIYGYKTSKERLIKQVEEQIQFEKSLVQSEEQFVYNESYPAFIEKEPKKANKSEEIFLNFNELADDLAQQELVRIHGKYEEESMVEEYSELIKNYINIILKHERNEG